MEVHLNILHRKLNLLCSWLQIKFPDDPTFPRSLTQEFKEPEFEVKPEEVADSEIHESLASAGSRCIQLVDLQSILESPNDRSTGTSESPPPPLTRSRKQNLSNLRTYGTQQYQTKPCSVNLKRVRSNVTRNPSGDTGGYDSSLDGESINSGYHILDADYEPQESESDDAESDETPSRRVLSLQVYTDDGNQHVPDPYLCTVCNMNFPNLNKLLLHKYKAHRAPLRVRRIHRCPECNKPFSRLACLRTHIEKYHPKVTQQNEDGELVTIVTRNTKTFVDRDPSLPCRFCGKLYRNRRFMRCHLLQKHSEVATPEEIAPLSLTCQLEGCGRRYRDTNAFNRHLQSFHPELYQEKVDSGEIILRKNVNREFEDHSNRKKNEGLNVPCRFCGKLYRNRRFMRRHLRQKHSEEATPEEMAPLSLTCQLEGCGRRYNNTNAFNFHLQTFHPELYQEKVDSGEIILRKNVNREIGDHSSRNENERVNCPECHKLLKSSSLRAHIRYMHSKCEQPPKPLDFLCPHCGVRKKSKHQLEIHMETHVQERKYKCGLCPFAARQKSGLRGHMLHMHTPNREKQQCPLCGDLFMRADVLQRHISRVHENQRPFPCNLCEKAFKDSNHLKYHLKTHENPNARKRGLNKEREARRRRAPNKSSQNKPDQG